MIRHARHIVAGRPLGAFFFGNSLHIVRQLFRVLEEIQVQALDNVGHLCLFFFGILVKVYRLVHKALQLLVGILHALIHADNAFKAICHHRAYQGGKPLGFGVSQLVRYFPRDILLLEHPRPDGVVNIVVYVGNAVCPPHNPPFGGFRLQAVCVAQNPVCHLIGQVQPPAVLFQSFNHPHALLVVPEASRHQGVQGPLPGVAKGGVPQIMGQGHRLRQILVQPQSPCNGAGNLGNLQRVGKPGAVVIPLWGEEHLGLVL